MMCPECRLLVPAGMIACPACAHKRSALAMRIAQQAALREVAAGHGDLLTRAINGRQHVKQFGCDLTFCGLVVSPQARRGAISWDAAEQFDKVCDRCQAEIQTILHEAPV